MPLGQDRVGWVDYAKGFCIVMVVMMHSTLGVEQAAGATSFMGAVVAFAKPFRMPDFFPATRTLLLKFAPGLDLGLVALIVTAVAAITPLLFYAAAKDTHLGFLFKRPAWARLGPPSVSEFRAGPSSVAPEQPTCNDSAAVSVARARARCG